MNKFCLMMGVVVISIWSNSVMSGCFVNDVEGFSYKKEFATAKTFSEAIEMLKKAEAGLYVTVTTDQKNVKEVKTITVTKKRILKDPGYCFDILNEDGSRKKTIIPGEDPLSP